jgi:phosphatidylglycerol:prolipoprotein diacylglycerol transferase
MLLRIHGEIGIRYYGLAYVLAFLIAFFLLDLMRKQNRIALTPEQQSSLFSYLIFGVFLGGRIGYALLYALEESIRNPLFVLQIWHGGMSSHGGFAGVVIALILFCRKYKTDILALGDAAAVMTPPGLFLGRIANFINGELWGIPSNVDWAVIFPLSAPQGTPIAAIPPRHPSQLYEAGLEGLLLMVYTLWRMFGKKTSPKPGNLAAEFLIIYAIVRIMGEQFREPDASLIAGVSRGVFFSIFLFLGGISLRIYTQKKHHVETNR